MHRSLLAKGFSISQVGLAFSADDPMSRCHQLSTSEISSAQPHRVHPVVGIHNCLEALSFCSSGTLLVYLFLFVCQVPARTRRAALPAGTGLTAAPGFFPVMCAFQHVISPDLVFPFPVSVMFIFRTCSLKIYFCTDLGLNVPLLAPNVCHFYFHFLNM